MINTTNEGLGAENHTEKLSSVAEYLFQANSLTLIRHLIPLTIAVQQHRGASLALFEGDISFEQQVTSLQDEISVRLKSVELLNVAYGHAMSEKQWQEVNHEWLALVSQWREDSVITNFEFHCKLIEKIIRITWQLVLDANSFFSSRLIDSKRSNISFLNSSNEGPAVTPSFNDIDHHILVQLVLKDVPRAIETIAKIRGLATHATVSKVCDETHQTRLIYLMQTLNYEKEKLRSIPRSLRKETLQGLPTLMETLLHEYKLEQLLKMVNTQVIVPGYLSLESHAVFDLATDIIEVYSAVIDQGVVLIQKNIDASLLG